MRFDVNTFMQENCAYFYYILANMQKFYTIELELWRYFMEFLLKERRIELGLTLKDVADYVGVSEATVSRWESGNIANMKRSRVQALAEILKVSPLDIIGVDRDEEAHIQELLQDLRDNPQIGVLLSASKDLNEEDIAQLTELAKRLRASYRD